ncbi:MAG TPA: hypothetical protein VGE52_02395 [Pirellulales bacterium]
MSMTTTTAGNVHPHGDAFPRLVPTDDDRQPGDPSPEEIAEACARIRAGWSEKTRVGRLVHPVARVVARPLRVTAFWATSESWDFDATGRADAA